MDRDENAGNETGGGTMTSGSRLVRRRRAVIVTAAIAVILSVGGLLGSGLVQSPSQAAADSQPPKPSVITATVSRTLLRSTVVLRGTFSDGRTQSAAPTSVAATEASSAPAQLMITGVYTRSGASVGAGRALVEYSGRPVFALLGDLPAYRDLVFEEQGKDVAQLQAALESSSCPTGSDPKGVFGRGTEAAVRKLYRKLGYPVPVTMPTAAHGKVHAMVPTSEVVFVPFLPARVVSVPVQVGDPVKGPVVTLARGGMTLTGQLDPSQAGLVTAGMKAQVLSEATGAQADGTVESVGALVTPETSATSDESEAAPANGGVAYLPLRVRPSTAWDAKLAGQDVRITITAAATRTPVLAVPQAALSAGADARTTVTVVGADGSQRVVPVRAGVSADGMVEVTPQGDGTLAAGDKVVVGQ